MKLQFSMQSDSAHAAIDAAVTFAAMQATHEAPRVKTPATVQAAAQAAINPISAAIPPTIAAAIQPAYVNPPTGVDVKVSVAVLLHFPALQLNAPGSVPWHEPDDRFQFLLLQRPQTPLPIFGPGPGDHVFVSVHGPHALLAKFHGPVQGVPGPFVSACAGTERGARRKS